MLKFVTLVKMLLSLFYYTKNREPPIHRCSQGGQGALLKFLTCVAVFYFKCGAPKKTVDRLSQNISLATLLQPLSTYVRIVFQT